jgi:hypothetical protein
MKVPTTDQFLYALGYVVGACPPTRREELDPHSQTVYRFLVDRCPDELASLKVYIKQEKPT